MNGGQGRPQDAHRVGRLRHRLADAIEAGIAALDALDSDPDFEPDADDEDGHDLEPCCEDEGAQCDDEGWDSDR